MKKRARPVLSIRAPATRSASNMTITGFGMERPLEEMEYHQDAEAGRRSREAVSKKKTLERDRKLVREYSDLQAKMPGAKKKVLKGILCDRHGIPIDTLNKALSRGQN
jgi:hypothetical protein